jgi:hypothetical protein
MAGYSDTPLPTYLGIRAGSRVLLRNPPPGFVESLMPLPERTQLMERADHPVDVIVLFARQQTEIRAALPAAIGRLKRDGGLWIAWPKKSAGTATDLSFESVQRSGLRAGLVDDKSCAIDSTWSALRFINREGNRTSAANPKT